MYREADRSGDAAPNGWVVAEVKVEPVSMAGGQGTYEYAPSLLKFP